MGRRRAPTALVIACTCDGAWIAVRGGTVSSNVTAPRLGSWSRLAAIAAIPLMGATLLFAVWSTVASIRSASATTLRGEAAALQAAVMNELFNAGGAAAEASLGGVVADHAHVGLRYAALVGADGQVLSQAGAAPGDVADLARWAREAAPGQPIRVGELARVVHRPTIRRPPRSHRPLPPAVVLEFEPRISDELETTAGWLLVIGIAAALTLTGVAGLLVRWSLGRERAVRTAEQARRLATLGQVSAVLAHEIRNPLASLKGNAQLLAMSMPEGERGRAKADRVVAEATRLETLSNDLLEFARHGELRTADVDPVAVAREVADSIAPHRIQIDGGDAPRSWPADRDKLRSVLVNLVENAAAMSDGSVEIRVGRRGRDLAIAVRDHGPGIADADLGHVFEPFFTRRERGTGLGLAVARRLVELHGGTITASNAAGGGAVFTLTLPRTSR
jgi:two-component system sensor histidine kinase HydH